MKIEKKYKITNDGELIYAKSDLKNFLKRQNFNNLDYFIFALMELGTNILKYPKKGEIWLLSDEDDFLLAALDRGEGIFNLDWALKKGTSTKNSLGLGLYQLSQSKEYKLDIFSSTKKPHGTVALIRPNKEKRIVYLIENFLDLPYGGDFVLRKGKYIIVGDVSGHGKRAEKSAEEIKKFFLENLFSCVLIDDVLKKLDEKIKKEHLRGVVLTILEITKLGINVCGVGTNRLYVKSHNEVKFLSFKDGVVGEVFSSTSIYSFKEYSQIFVTTDGINEKIMYNILSKTNSLYLSVIAGVYFNEDKDDKTILGVRYEL